MTIVIVIVSITIGFFLGYKVGYYRCKYQFKLVLEGAKVWYEKELAKNQRK